MYIFEYIFNMYILCTLMNPGYDTVLWESCNSTGFNLINSYNTYIVYLEEKRQASEAMLCLFTSLSFFKYNFKIFCHIFVFVCASRHLCSGPINNIFYDF